MNQQTKLGQQTGEGTNYTKYPKVAFVKTDKTKSLSTRTCLSSDLWITVTTFIASMLTWIWQISVV